MDILYVGLQGDTKFDLVDFRRSPPLTVVVGKQFYCSSTTIHLPSKMRSFLSKRRIGQRSTIILLCALGALLLPIMKPAALPHSLRIHFGLDRTIEVDREQAGYWQPRSSVEELYMPLMLKFFSPWLPVGTSLQKLQLHDADLLSAISTSIKPITNSAITALEFIAKGSGIRIRYTGEQLLYRQLQVFEQTYRVDRIHWWLNLLAAMHREGLLKSRNMDGSTSGFR